MNDNNVLTTETPVTAEPTVTVNESPASDEKKGAEFKFFKSCSSSLKRFSVILFIVNLFLSITAVGVGVVLLAVYVGIEMVPLLALPILTAMIIMVLLARFVSALVYGFAEIVEKSEKK